MQYNAVLNTGPVDLLLFQVPSLAAALLHFNMTDIRSKDELLIQACSGSTCRAHIYTLITAISSRLGYQLWVSYFQCLYIFCWLQDKPTINTFNETFDLFFAVISTSSLVSGDPKIDVIESNATYQLPVQHKVQALISADCRLWCDCLLSQSVSQSVDFNILHR